MTAGERVSGLRAGATTRPGHGCLTSAWVPVEEALAAGRAARSPLGVPGVAAEDVEQLAAHLVAALAELNCHYGHRAASPEDRRTKSEVRRRVHAAGERFRGGAVSFILLLNVLPALPAACPPQEVEHGISGPNCQNFQNKMYMHLNIHSC